MSGGNLFVLSAVQLVLTAVPGIAAALLAMRLGARALPLLLASALVGSGVAAMLVFWVFYLSPSLGAPSAYAIFFGSIGLAVWAWPAGTEQRALLRRLRTPLALWVLGSLFVVFFGFLHGGTEAALETGGYRFSTAPNQMASDNFIPWFFSDWIVGGSPSPPPIFEPGWHLSDRPPLQVGYIVSQRPFGWDLATLHVELIGVVAQQLWIVGLWAVLEAARVSTRTRALVMVAALVSDVTVVNAFYVWPKLLAAAFALAALALIIDRDAGLRSSATATVLFGALCGLSYLAHGSTVFGLFPLLVLLLIRDLPSWRWLAAALAVALLLVLPWSAFQRYADPPGNRVVKWGLSGYTEIDDRGTAEAVVDAYREVGLGGALENKLRNFLTMAGVGPATDAEEMEWIHFHNAFDDSVDAVSDLWSGQVESAVSEIRESRFSHLLWTVGLLILALPAIAVGALRGRIRAGPDWELARVCAFVFAVGAVAWGLVMFGNVPGRAVVIAGSMVLPILAVAGLVAGLRATYPSLAPWLVGANVVTVLLIYLPVLEPRPGTSFEAFNAIVAVTALAGFVAVACGARWARWYPKEAAP
ncbi:MAG TPA: hypothetical protein VHR18_11670 [Solirubrobacterales bacterium]|nr:hypothetical protein [Solirubrobacterales bacterium]